MRDTLRALLIVGIGVLVVGAIAAVVMWPRSDDRQLDELSDLSRGCPSLGNWGARPLTRAPAHDSGAPHPVAVLVRDADDWEPLDGWSVNPADVQLIACGWQQGPGGQLTTCPFDFPSPTTVPVLDHPYKVRVVEARTGKVLRVFEVHAGASYKCPTSTSHQGNPELWAEPGAAEFRTALAELTG